MLALFLLTSAVGGSLALESSYLPVTLASHIGLALVTLALCVFAALMVGPRYKSLPRAISWLTVVSAVTATIAGTIYLVDGQHDAQLYLMEAFAGIGIVASILLILFGGSSGTRASPAESA